LRKKWTPQGEEKIDRFEGRLEKSQRKNPKTEARELGAGSSKEHKGEVFGSDRFL